MKVNIEQVQFTDCTMRYGLGAHIQQGGESVVLDAQGARLVIAELLAWLKECNPE